ncbi:hypothetical protein CVT24_002223 [Panaeolus cyanescens]|uniref:F-box domain-containing protein n=1 Tax=Panaeolus cyanescens TaxID=181874 RepID=A0A409YID5_9AGAR|nr:hypothetical protein CVT24_002223 [Panaeolus cyanescens]
MDIDLASNPVLPPELERIIFEMAFDTNEPHANSRLVLVAKRVRSWIRPLIYSTFILMHSKPFPNMEKCPDFIDIEEICQFAHNLVIGLQLYLSSTAAAPPTRRSCWGKIVARRVWPSLSKLSKLRRLSADIRHLPSKQFLSATFCPHLTHLEIRQPSEDWEPEDLISLTILTHFAIRISTRDSPDRLDYKRLGAVVRACLSLRVFVLYNPFEGIPSDAEDLYAAEYRMVLIDISLFSLGHWKRGEKGDNDNWAYAEQVVLMRRAEYFIDISEDARVTDSIYPGFSWDERLTEEGMEWVKSSILSELLE